MEETLLQIKNLTINVNATRKSIVDDVELNVAPAGLVALVGGSGSGKTTTGYAILDLLHPALSVAKGEISFQGTSIRNRSKDDFRRLRGGEISMVFQEPLNAFNPVFTIGYQMDEMMLYHTNLTKEQRLERAYHLLKLVGLDEPKRVAQSYPHQLSGGMRQRAMIAQAIAADPKLLIADEPTSNLDVTLQARIIELFQKIREELKLAILLITHDLGMARHLCETTYVMQQGRIVENGLTADVLSSPQHSYTKELLKALE